MDIYTMLHIIAIAALLLILGILRVRRKVAEDEKALQAYLAELVARKDRELRDYASSGVHDRLRAGRFGDLSRTAR